MKQTLCDRCVKPLENRELPSVEIGPVVYWLRRTDYQAEDMPELCPECYAEVCIKLAGTARQSLREASAPVGGAS